MARFTVILAFLISTYSELDAQQYVQYFSGQFDAGKKDVVLHWTVPSGVTSLSGYEVQRSYDSVNFNGTFSSIYANYTVFGSPSNSQQYSFRDTLPVMHTRNYYRIQPMGAGYSEIIGVDAGERADNYRLSPSVVSDISKLDFENKDGAAYVLEIANIKGTLLYRFEGITTNYFYIHSSWFEKTEQIGFRMYKPDGSGLIKGKFVVQKL